MGLGVADHATAFGLGCGEGLFWALQHLISSVYIPMTPEHLGGWSCICVYMCGVLNVHVCVDGADVSVCTCGEEGALSAEILHLG